MQREASDRELDPETVADDPDYPEVTFEDDACFFSFPVRTCRGGFVALAKSN